MSQLTVQILSGMCCGFGNCAALCPKSSRLTTTATGPGSCPARLEDYAAEIAQAASECPTQAIHVVAFEDQARASHG